MLLTFDSFPTALQVVADIPLSILLYPQLELVFIPAFFLSVCVDVVCSHVFVSVHLTVVSELPSSFWFYKFFNH